MHMSVTEEHLDNQIDAVNCLIREKGFLQRQEREFLGPHQRKKNGYPPLLLAVLTAPPMAQQGRRVLQEAAGEGLSEAAGVYLPATADAI